jgi:hypothetical protein
MAPVWQVQIGVGPSASFHLHSLHAPHSSKLCLCLLLNIAEELLICLACTLTSYWMPWRHSCFHFVRQCCGVVNDGT